MRRKRHAKENPTTAAWLAMGAGVAVLGVGVYFLTRKSATTPAVVAANAPPQIATAAARPTPPSLGNPSDSNSVAFACNTCWKLSAIGRPEAAFWRTKCVAGGGVVPTSAAEQYT